MTSRSWKRKRRGKFYTILTDILINLLAFYMLLVGIKSNELAKSQKIAVGLKHKVSGLQGDLENANEDLTQANKTGAKYQAVIAGQKKTIGKLGNKISEIKKHFRAGAPVTLIIMIDTSISMKKMIPAVSETMATVFETLPQHSSDFRISVLGFRKGVVKEFPITKIEPYYVDDGKSQQEALAFIDSLSVADSFTEHFSVFKKAVSSLKAAHPEKNSKRKERILFIGDVACSELDNKHGYNDAERDANKAIESAMRKWGRWGDHAIVSLYVKSDHTIRDPGAAESEAWFKKLGSINQRSAFHTDASILLRAVLKTARN